MAIRYLSGINVDSNTLFVDDANNRVGVGTASPTGKLELYTATGNTTLFVTTTGGGSYVPKISLDKRGDSAWNISSPAGGFNFNIDQDGSSRLWISSTTGSIGFGTTSPNGNLHVASSSQTRVLIENTGNDANGAGLIMTVRSSGTIVGNGGIYVDNSNNLILYNGGVYAGNERVRINNSGYVGINTTAPSSFLTVSPGGSGNAATFTSTANAINNYVGITLNAVTVSGVEWYGSEIRNINTNGSPGFLNPRLGFFTQNASTYLPADRTEKMSILGNGNVGIGTTAPNTKLQISGGNSSTASTALFSIQKNEEGYGLFSGILGSGTSWFQSSTKNESAYYALTLQPNGGNVGIGTTSPAAKLTVSGTTYLNLTSDYFGASTTVQISSGGGSNAVGILSNTFYLYPYSSNTTTSLVYGYNGNASWGLTNAGGNSRFDFYSYAAGSSIMSITSSGNVGIGTTSPSEKLHVYGNLKVDGQTFMTSGFSSYTTDGLFSASALWNGVITPSGVYRIRLGYLDQGGGQYWGRIGFVANTNWSLGTSQGGNSFSIGTGNGNNEFLIDNAGNVGIGTTSPGYKLDVAGSINTNDVYRIGGNTILSGTTNVAVGSAGGTGSVALRTTSGDGLVLSGSSVGIGTTSPTSKLEVFDGDISVTTSGSFSFLNLNRNFIPNSSGVLLGGIKYRGYSTGTTYQSGAYIYSYSSAAWTSTSSPGYLSIQTTPSGSTTPVERMLVASNGAIKLNAYGSGSNTGTATQRLAVDASGNVIEIPIGSGPVDGNGTANYVTKWSDADTITNSIIYDNGTNVGIGTTSPGYKLHVNGDTFFNGSSIVSGNGQVLTINGTNHAYYAWSIANTRKAYAGFGSSGSTTFELINENTGGFIIGTNGGQQIIINSAGNVGIGTTSAASKLHVLLNGNTSGGPTGNVASFQNSSAGNNAYVTLFGAYNAEAGIVFTDESEQFKGKIGYNNNSENMYFQTDGAERLRIDSSGYIYLNTYLFAYEDVSYTRLYRPNGTAGIYLGGTGDQANYYDNTTHYFRSSGGGTYYAIINSSGNLGIGTTSPSYKLDVRGNLLAVGPNGGPGIIGIWEAESIASTGGSIVSDSSASGGSAWTTNGNYQLFGPYTNLPRGNYRLSVRVKVADASYTGNAVRINAYIPSVGSAQDRYIKGIDFSANDTWEMFSIPFKITGITANNVEFYVFGLNSQSISVDYLSVTVDNDSYTAQNWGNLYVNGNVGIGTTAQLARTTILSDSSAQTIGLIGRSADNIATIRWWNNAGNTVYTAIESNANYTIYNTVTNGYAAFFTNNSERVRITSAGNVGIGTTSPSNKLIAVNDATFNGENSYSIAAAASSDTGYKTVIGYDYANDIGVISAVRQGIQWKNLSILPVGNTNLGVGTITPSERLHVSGNIRVTGAYYDSNNEAGTSGQVLSSTGSGTDWVTPATTTASSLYDLLPAARTTYDWTVQMTSGTWADIFSSNTVLSNGTWMVQVYVSDYASGGEQYMETYSGVLSWGSAGGTNAGGANAISEVVLHRSGHSAQAGNFYLRTQERLSSTLLLQGMVNYSHTSNTTINFKFVKVF